VRQDYVLQAGSTSPMLIKYGYPQGTDLWLHFDHNTPVTSPCSSPEPIRWPCSVSGSISPVDLLHLAGHFEIPRMEGGWLCKSRGNARRRMRRHHLLRLTIVHAPDDDYGTRIPRQMQFPEQS
jgi:hypothetical protein